MLFLPDGAPTSPRSDSSLWRGLPAGVTRNSGPGGLFEVRGMSMDCPYCEGAASHIMDTQSHPSGVWRRRICHFCCETYGTIETPTAQIPVLAGNTIKTVSEDRVASIRLPILGRIA